MLIERGQGGEGGFAGLGSLKMFCHSESIFVGKLLLLCCVTVFEDRVEDGNILAGPSKECQKRKPKICPDLVFFSQTSSGCFLGVVVVLCDIMPVLV